MRLYQSIFLVFCTHLAFAQVIQNVKASDPA